MFNQSSWHSFYRKHQINEHESKYLNDGSIACKKCDKTFSLNRRFIVHYIHQHLKVLYSCDRCSVSFFKKAHLLAHQKQKHKDPKPPKNREIKFSKKRRERKAKTHNCGKCEKSFNRNSTLTKHKVQDYGDLFKCQTCDRTSLEFCISEQQCFECYTNVKKCAPCDIEFPSAQDFEEHKMRNHDSRFNSAASNFECAKCNKYLKNPCDMRRHILMEHSTFVFTCRICFGTFSFRANYLQHLKTHNIEIEQTDQKPVPGQSIPSRKARFKCDDCSKKFKKLTRLNTHARIEHKKNIFQCKICKDFSDAFCVTKQKCFKCLKRHCDICDKRFKSARALTFHVEKKHVSDYSKHSENQFECKLCGKSFSSLRSVQQHLRLSHLAMIFTCKTCLKSFSNFYILKRHQKTHSSFASSNDQDEELETPRVKKTFNVEKEDVKVFQREVQDPIDQKQTIKPPSSKVEHSEGIPLLEDFPENVHRNFTNMESFKCEDCDLVFDRLTSLVNHAQTDHKKNILQCENCKGFSNDFCGAEMLCSKCFDAEMKLESPYRRNCIKHSDQDFECRKCSKHFGAYPNFCQHFRGQHLLFLFRCGFCHRVFNDKRNMKNHKLKCHKRTVGKQLELVCCLV